MPQPDPFALALAVGDPLDAAISAGTASVAWIEVAGLPDGTVWSVSDETRDHPIGLQFGVFPDGTIRVLTSDQQAWAELVAATGAAIDVTNGIGYVSAYLWATRGPNVAVQVVQSVDELPWRPGSEPEEAAKAALLATELALEPIVLETGTGVYVILAVVVDQRLQRIDFEVTTAGAIEASFEVLGDGLPFPIAR